jgi:hypothetical protein
MRLRSQSETENRRESTVARKPTKRNQVVVELPDYIETFPTGAEDFVFLSSYLRIRSRAVRRALVALVHAIANSPKGSGTSH